MHIIFYYVVVCDLRVYLCVMWVLTLSVFLKVRGSPEPQVCWFRNGKVVIAGGRYSMEQSARGNFSLVVEGVQEDDAGRYTCEAINDAGTRHITVDIIVEGTFIVLIWFYTNRITRQ